MAQWHLCKLSFSPCPYHSISRIHMCMQGYIYLYLFIYLSIYHLLFLYLSIYLCHCSKCKCSSREIKEEKVEIYMQEALFRHMIMLGMSWEGWQVPRGSSHMHTHVACLQGTWRTKVKGAFGEQDTLCTVCNVSKKFPLEKPAWFRTNWR